MPITTLVRSVVTVFLSATLLLPISFVRADTKTVERIEWQKVPIEVSLIVDNEQRIEFPAQVKVGVPGSIQPLLRSQSVNGAVYLLANAPFDSSRLMVQEIVSGRIYLFDVAAADGGVLGGPIQVFVEEPIESNGQGSRDKTEPTPRQPSYVTLTRFAARQLYAPARLAKELNGVVREPVARESFELVHGGAIDAAPLVGWRAKGLYVTAVQLTNRTTEAQTLDPRELRGEWLTATFQHHRLLPKGDEADTTVVYLVSRRPFGVSR